MGKTKNKLKADVVVKNYWRNNEQFADFFNAVLYEGKQVIKPDVELCILGMESQEHIHYAMPMRVMGYDYAKIVYDNTEWYKKSAEYFLKTYPLEVHQFVMLDFSTLYDRDSFHQMIKEVLGITYLDIIDKPATERDCEHIVLYNNASFEFIDIVTPIIYFVDTFV